MDSDNDVSHHRFGGMVVDLEGHRPLEVSALGRKMVVRRPADY